MDLLDGTFRRSLVVVLAGAALVAPRTVVAQQDSKAIAEALFQDGRRLMDEGRTEEACVKFRESQRIEAKLGTLLNLAVCNEKLGNTASAWAGFTEAAALAARTGEEKREAFAREHVEALEPKLSRLVLRPTDPAPGLTISLDGHQLDAAVLETALPVDPGTRSIVAKAPGKSPWTHEIEIPEGPGETELVVPPLEDAPAAPAAAAPTPTPSGPTVPAPPPEPEAPPAPPPSRSPPLVWVGFSVAGAGLAMGTITGALSWSQTKGIKRECPQGQCDETHASDIDSATTLANVSNAGFAIGAAGAVVGVVGLFLSKEPESEKVGGGVRPVVGLGYLGTQGRF